MQYLLYCELQYKLCCGADQTHALIFLFNKLNVII